MDEYANQSHFQQAASDRTTLHSKLSPIAVRCVRDDRPEADGGSAGSGERCDSAR